MSSCILRPLVCLRAFMTNSGACGEHRMARARHFGLWLKGGHWESARVEPGSSSSIWSASGRPQVCTNRQSRMDSRAPPCNSCSGIDDHSGSGFSFPSDFSPPCSSCSSTPPRCASEAFGRERRCRNAQMRARRRPFPLLLCAASLLHRVGASLKSSRASVPMPCQRTFSSKHTATACR